MESAEVFVTLGSAFFSSFITVGATARAVVLPHAWHPTHPHEVARLEAASPAGADGAACGLATGLAVAAAAGVAVGLAG